jgi:hypothetical protein
MLAGAALLWVLWHIKPIFVAACILWPITLIFSVVGAIVGGLGGAVAGFLLVGIGAFLILRNA